MEKTQNQLVQSKKIVALGILAPEVFYEYNNTMASIYDFAQIAKKNGKCTDKLVDMVIKQSKRLCDIMERLPLPRKMRNEVKELIEVSKMIEHALQRTMSVFENKNIDIVKKFEPVPRILANPDKIQKVFSNIITNACHAIEQSGTITIRIFLKDKKNYVIFTDTGRGISKENQLRIFEPFTTESNFGGGPTGMGLTISYNIVKDLNGDITVESTLGQGSTFTVILPVGLQQ